MQDFIFSEICLYGLVGHDARLTRERSPVPAWVQIFNIGLIVFAESIDCKMRRPGIKPGSRPWQGRILSLYYRRTIFVLRFERRISRVLGERHNQARPYEHGEPSTRIELVTLRLLSACSAN